jgi:GAG-pre-integrase domain
LPQDISAEFLCWHHQLGHVSLKKIRLMAKQGILPQKLADCKVPLCTSCLFGKVTRRPWRSKTPNNQTEPSRTIIKPGDCISVDQLESTTPGLIAQLKGIPMTLQYKVATVFVDHFSPLGMFTCKRPQMQKKQ